MLFYLFDMQVPYKVIRGPLVDEVHQKFSSWIYQVSNLAYLGTRIQKVVCIQNPFKDFYVIFNIKWHVL